MNSYQKFTASFVLALLLHFSILAMFGVSFFSESKTELIKQNPLPEIIQASLLDDGKIELEAERLKDEETSKQAAQQEKQKKLENKLKKEQRRLDKIKKQRLQEEIKTKELEKKRKELALKEKQKREEINKLRAEEAARLAKIKVQKQAEALRAEKQRKAEKKKQEAERLEKQKKQQALAAKQKTQAKKRKADKARKEALKRQQAANAKAKAAQNNQAAIAAVRAIQRKVINSWVKPIASVKGLSSTIRVKLLPSGDVMDATIARSSGDSLFDRSAVNAVRKASPLPVPRDRALFTRRFRVFSFQFKPE